MASSPKHLSLPRLGSITPSSSLSVVLPMDYTMDKPPISENFPPSISSVLPPISSMKDQPLSSTPKVSSAGVISFLKPNVPIKSTNTSNKGGYLSSLPNHGGVGSSVRCTTTIVPKYILRTSSQAAIIGNNGVLKGSNMVTPLQNVMGMKKGFIDQGNRAGKPTHGAEDPNQPLSTFGNAEKPASKVEACPSKNVEGSKMVAPSKNMIGKKKWTKDQGDNSEKSTENLKHALGGVDSFGHSDVQQCKDIPTTSPLVVNVSNKAEGQPKCPAPIIPEIAHNSYCNVLKGDNYGSNMDGLIRRPMNLKYYQPFQSGIRTCVSPPLEVADDGSKSWKNCLVGHFIEKKLPFTLVKNIAMHIWGSCVLLEVLANEKGFYFFKFLDDEACSNVLEAGPWLFTGRMLILKKWHPRLILTKDTYSKIPVWVKLFNIPHEYWTEEGLSYIASAVGKPLYADSLI
ncbi:hypothetical protein Ddye_023746 [Dipteronia dyeriana]|uniref:DUF4283 domain-containing protein n=1 Tax=Dipteronia dyeriana TaxID=168575 RepID=A0AAD9TU54_9ROSI|nr:hypothetical protein Ddye_023746 [Dipteronia dyeriana]